MPTAPPSRGQKVTPDTEANVAMPQPGPQPGNTHRARNVALGIFAAVVALAILGALINHGQPQHHSPQSATAQVGEAPQQPSLSSGESAFVAAVRSALSSHGYRSPDSNAAIAKLGGDVCGLRERSVGQAKIIGLASYTESRFFITPALFVKTAERDICPSQVPQPSAVLLNMSGNGIENSAPFSVNTDYVTVSYSFSDCAGGSGNFIADLDSVANGPDSDSEPIANALSSGGSATTTVYP